VLGVNAGEILQRLAGVKMQHGTRARRPPIGGLLACRVSFLRGRARQAKGRSQYEGNVNLPAFITAKNLKPFIPNELYVTSSQIEFRTMKGGKAFGYPAELLPKIGGVFIAADEAGKLTAMQKKVAAKARVFKPCLGRDLHAERPQYFRVSVKHHWHNPRT
jgi:hypothetical protein